MANSDPRRSPADVRLRPVEREDLPALFQFQTDDESNQMAAVIPRDAEAFFAIWEKIFRDPAVVARAIEADGKLVGSISVFKMDGQDAVGYWIARDCWGRGIATRALGLLLKEVALRPLHARAARSNAASIRVLERCGFVVTGYQHSGATERYLACEEAVLILE